MNLLCQQVSNRPCIHSRGELDEYRQAMTTKVVLRLLFVVIIAEQAKEYDGWKCELEWSVWVKNKFADTSRILGMSLVGTDGRKSYWSWLRQEERVEG